MANHPSALKRHRQSLKRRQRNRDAKSTIRTTLKKVTQLLESGDKEAAAAHARLATKLFDKAAVHGVLHKKNAARSISRLQARLNAAQ
jgi:small subunit ribosomal protein S20